jgi:hypothetical protein
MDKPARLFNPKSDCPRNACFSRQRKPIHFARHNNAAFLVAISEAVSLMPPRKTEQNAQTTNLRIGANPGESGNQRKKYSPVGDGTNLPSAKMSEDKRFRPTSEVRFEQKAMKATETGSAVPARPMTIESTGKNWSNAARSRHDPHVEKLKNTLDGTAERIGLRQSLRSFSHPAGAWPVVVADRPLIIGSVSIPQFGFLTYPPFTSNELPFLELQCRLSDRQENPLWKATALQGRRGYPGMGGSLADYTDAAKLRTDWETQIRAAVSRLLEAR